MRFELPMKSRCDTTPLPTEARFTTAAAHNAGSPSQGCWMPPLFQKAVIVVIDALRYDFVATQPTNGASPYFHNLLPGLTSLAATQPSQTILRRFMADSPTVTMQRIKGITTGSLPTFIDVGANFGGDAIVEDNLIHQLSFQDDVSEATGGGSRRKVVFIGDDTWVSLFPHHFYSQYPFPSFNVKDLHTVDNGVIDNLLPTITRLQAPSDSPAWHIAIGHLLGVDHVGHSYGPSHPEMIKKLNQMDEFLLSIINNMDDNTLFVLFGDHGMTPDGNHGGSSIEETEAALFMYSKSVPINSTSLASKMFPSTAGSETSQIDLVSTLSLMLGVPIPFGNLGGVMPEPFLSNVDNGSGGWRTLIDAQRLNAWQIQRYIEAYSKVSTELPRHQLTKFAQQMDAAETLYSRLSTTSDDAAFHAAYSAYRRLQLDVVDLCRAIWATFDTMSMMAGIATLTSAAVSIVGLVYGAIQLKCRNSSEGVPFSLNKLLLWALIGAVLGTLLAMFFVPSGLSWMPLILFAASLGSTASIIHTVISWTTSFSSVPRKSTKLRSIINVGTLLFAIPIGAVILHGASLSSNSFIEAQPHVVHYMLLSVILVALGILASLRRRWTVSNIAEIGLLVISLYFASPAFLAMHVGDNVKLPADIDPTLSAASISTLLLNSLPQWLWCVPVLLLFMTEVSRRLDIAYFPPRRSFIRSHMASAAFVAAAANFYVQDLSVLSQLSWVTRGLLPWTVYALSLTGLFHSLVWPPSSRPPITPATDIKQVVFRQIEVVGLVFSVMVLLLGAEILSTLFWMVVHTVLLTKTLGSLTHLLHSARKPAGIAGPATKELLASSLAGACWGFLGLLHFFSTGHDSSFNAIQFESAYVGFEEHVYWRGALLVILNTFASPIFFALVLPVVVAATMVVQVVSY
eukprot:gene6808-7913_t